MNTEEIKHRFECLKWLGCNCKKVEERKALTFWVNLVTFKASISKPEDSEGWVFVKEVINE